MRLYTAPLVLMLAACVGLPDGGSGYRQHYRKKRYCEHCEENTRMLLHATGQTIIAARLNSARAGPARPA